MKRFFTSNIIIFLMPILVTSCYEKKSDDPSKCYKLWSGTNPPKELILLKGNYWQSAHWTKEYVLYLKLKPNTLWWKELIKQNSLKVDNLDWNVPSDAPSWFVPAKNSCKWKSNDKFIESRFINDTITSICYIYDKQF